MEEGGTWWPGHSCLAALCGFGTGCGAELGSELRQSHRVGKARAGEGQSCALITDHGDPFTVYPIPLKA